MYAETVTPLSGLVTKICFSTDFTEDELGRLIAYSVVASLISHKVNTESKKHLKYEQMRLLYIDLEKTLDSCEQEGYLYGFSRLNNIVSPFMKENLPPSLDVDSSYQHQPLLKDLILYVRDSGLSWQDQLRRLGIDIKNNIEISTNFKKVKKNCLRDYEFLEKKLKKY